MKFKFCMRFVNALLLWALLASFGFKIYAATTAVPATKTDTATTQAADYTLLKPGAGTSVVKGKEMSDTAAKTEAQYQDHGWAKLDVINIKSPYSVLFYSEPRGLDTLLMDGAVVRIRALKTGYGSFYRVAKKDDGVWRLYADTMDPGDDATQFMVSKVGKYITLISEAAGGFFVESDPKTFDVLLQSDKAAEAAMWELVEDPKAGDTLDTCYLKNKVTGGLLTASFDSSGGGDEAEIGNLKNQIDELEKKYPYLKITYARTGGVGNNVTMKGSVDIAKKLNARVQGNLLRVTGKNWVTEISGKSKAASGWLLGRKVKIRYVEGNSPDEKEYSGKEGKSLEIIADLNKHPATPLRKQLEALQLKNAGIKKLATSDIGRTGFQSTPFSMTQWSKVAIDLAVDIPTSDDEGAPKDTIAGGSSRNLYIGAHKRPEFKGSGSERIDGFGPEMVVTVNPLYSRGFAWIEQSLPIPGQGTITFRAISSDGDVHVCFSNDVAPQTVYRIAFGAAGNTKTVIYKNEEVMQEVSSDQNPNARITPGMIEQFWVSILNGFIMLGKGDAGSNIIMAWQDPKPTANIQRIGFSTYKSIVKFTDVNSISDPIVTVIPAMAYVSDARSIQIGTGDAPAWHSLPLSPADAGTVVFEATGTEDASLYLANDKNEGYRVAFGVDGNTATKIISLSNTKELYTIDTTLLPLAALNVGAASKFWVSLYKGLVIIGSGDVGKNVFCVFVDKTSPKGITKIGFGGKSSIQNLEIWPEVELGFDQNVSEYAKSRNFSSFKGALSLITPFQYRILQEGPIVKFIDRLTGAQWNMASTPEPDSEYHFKIDILQNGEPQVNLLFQDPSAEKVKIQASIKLLEAGAESSFRLGQTMAYGTGPEIVSSLTALGSAAAASAIGAGLRLGQAAQENKLNELSQLANRYVATERVAAAGGGTATVSSEDQSNKTKLETTLTSILQYSMNDPKEFEYAVKLWSNAIKYITGSYVISDNAVKKQLVSGLQSLYKAINQLDLTNSTLTLFQMTLNTYIEAYNNAYLTTFGDPESVAQRNDWYVVINDLSSRMMKSTSLMQLGIDIDFKGEYLWFPVKLPKAGSGSVTFEARAYNNIFVGLSENPYKVRNVANRMYEIVIGMWDNKLTAIHRKSLGDSVVEFDHKKYPGLSPDPSTYKKYWINVDKGVVSLGVGELGQGKLVEWKDPYPAAPVTSVGFSNWLAGVSIKNVRVGYPVFMSGASVSRQSTVPAEDTGSSETASSQVATTSAPATTSTSSAESQSDTAEASASPDTTKAVAAGV